MYVRVHAVPDARKEKVIEEDSVTFTIFVREPALRNQANKRIQAILGQKFKVTPTQVRLLTGHRSSSKMYSIEILD